MSHIEEGKTSLVFADLPALLRLGDHTKIAQHPCIALLRQAVSMVATEHGGEVKPYYYNYGYEEQSTHTGLALHIPRSAEKPYNQALPRGIGLLIDEQTGALIFRGDPWNVKDFFKLVQQQIIQKYTVLAHMAALKQMQYQVSTQEIDGRIHITGVTYA